MHSVIFKNDAVGDLVHSIDAINNIVSSGERVTIFLSKLSQNFSFLLKNKNVSIKILNYNLSIFERLKIVFFLLNSNVNKAYILSPKNFYFFLPFLFRKIKFYGICVNNVKNYKRPHEFLRKYLYKYEINDRGKAFKRESSRTIQKKLTYEGHNEYKFNINVKKSEILQNFLPNDYIFFHFKKKIFNELNWKYKELELLFREFHKYCNNIVITKDIEFDENNNLFKQNFNSYDFKSKKFIDNNKNIMFFDNVVGEDLFNIINYSNKVIAFHGMMTNLGFLLNKQVLDLYHCKINSWEDYRRYRNSFYEFKPKYKNYDFIIPKPNINKTIKKIKFSLEKCQKI
tara:strand:+ start:917 stop:1942 length:1026 start_codon:yes stop_codon:yes gene_type:complete